MSSGDVHSLRKNNLGPNGAAALAPGLAANSGLTKLDVRFNDMSSEAKEMIRKAVEGCEGFVLQL